MTRVVSEKLNLDQAFFGIGQCTGCIHGLVVDGVPTCEVNKSPIDFFRTSFACPKGKWKHEIVYMRGISDAQVRFDEELRVLWLSKPDAKREAELDAEYERVPGALRWRVGESFSADMVGFLRSMGSGRTAAPEIVATRRASCFGVDGGPQCVALKRTEAGAFCSACRCPERALARLDGDQSKLTFGYLECPMGKPGFSNARVQKA